MDVWGFLSNNGFGLFNSLLLVCLFFLVRDRVVDLETKVKVLWDWHNIQTGVQQARLQHREDHDHE